MKRLTLGIVARPMGARLTSRVGLSLACGLLAAQLSYLRAASESRPRDLAALWIAARALLSGHDPYTASPGLLYPLPSVIAATPFALVPSASLACWLFMLVGASAFAYALLEHGRGTLLGFVAPGMLFAAEVVQWTPLHASAYALAPLGVFLIVKPHTGFPIFAAKPSWWAFGAGVVCVLAAFAIDPAWLTHWRASLALGGGHLGTATTGFPYAAPVLLPGGVLVLVALLRWRRPEARLLVALACVPQSLYLYDTVPLFLIPRTFRESALLVVLSYAVLYLMLRGGPYPDMAHQAVASGRLYTLLLYLPATLMVLRRSNEGALPAWLEVRLSWLPAWLRGREPLSA